LTKLERILHTLDDKKATNIVVMDLSDVELIHDKMVIASVNNPRLLNALKDYVIQDLAKDGYEIHHFEGNDESDWLLIDVFDIVVHLFLDESRLHYSLDRLWADKIMIGDQK
jgi:ribosome-associated protein